MAKMVKCKTCGADIAKTAKCCPNCGAPNNQQIPLWGRIIIAAVAAVMLIIMISDRDDSDDSASTSASAATTTVKETATPEPAIEVTASELYSAYAENAVNADSIYKNKTVSVTGTITDIGQDILTNKPCVSLASGDAFGIYSVQCFFKDATDEIAALRDGDTITITGTCTGANLGIVQLSSCAITG